MKSTAFVAVLVFLIAWFSESVCAQSHDKKDEIPIERCDRLPVIITKVAGEPADPTRYSSHDDPQSEVFYPGPGPGRSKSIRGVEAQPPGPAKFTCRK